MAIVGLKGLTTPKVRRALDLYQKGGWLAISPANRGREKGQGRLLSAEQKR